MKCPGQDPRYWKFDAIFDASCPKCGATVEFFKDETRRRCKNCGHQVLNPKMDFGCAAHCKFAEQCFGDLPPELIKQKEDLFKDKVAVQMKLYFKNDFKRIGHSARVASIAEKLALKENAAPPVVLTAAYLHDIGAVEAMKKFNSDAPEYQEQEGPAVAREILERLDAKPEMIDEVCDIISHHHHPREDESANFKTVYDSDILANVQEKLKKSAITVDEAKKIFEERLLTDSGKAIGNEIIENLN
ncbi:MAG: HD domain-containing protein [Syntrophaceae bacterium]|nr:HD domain-containing protein [Syntrophaceae bacterium]